MTSVHNYRKHIKIQFLSIAIEESTNIRRACYASCWIFWGGGGRWLRYNNMSITEELLEIIPLDKTITGEDIFDGVWRILEKCNFPVGKLVSDGTKSMTGQTKESASRQQKNKLII
ncbi:hypothetical protein CDAR_218151 [Caerostris darwini]|uniref:DUF4371 domain-containing protein n=1 Tax=Caerostris darwini TaxID=1538125 RepID=A0AAV4TFU9_9ARAC|nr:hypothetical protein CDAR_218151 [Caerostris darwini]